jgi:protein-disulfide isomerase
MREIWSSLLILLTLAGAPPALAQAPGNPPPAGNPAEVLKLTQDDRILGKPDAPITIVEYASLTCPHCRHFTIEVLPKVKEKWIDTGKAKLVLRDYPLDEPALRAAMIARCAPPAKFYGFIDQIFAEQQKWALAPDYKAALAKLVLLGGMSKAQFDRCLADKAGEERVLQSRLTATQQLGVSSTPTFFIDGAKFEGDPSVEGFDAALTRAAK